jgi:hypothetical protein
VCSWRWDRRGRPGDRLQDIIRTQLDEADAFVLFIGPDSQHSHWVRYEMSEVLKRTWSDPSKLVVPVLIGDAQLPGYLRDYRNLRVQSAGSPDVFRELLRDLSARQAASGFDSKAPGSPGRPNPTPWNWP